MLEWCEVKRISLTRHTIKDISILGEGRLNFVHKLNMGTKSICKNLEYDLEDAIEEINRPKLIKKTRSLFLQIESHQA